MTLKPEPRIQTLPATDRRCFLRTAFGVAASATIASAWPGSQAWAHGGLPRTRSLAFLSLHTGEKLSATYVKGGAFDRSAMAEINWILRDWRCGDQARMDPDLLDLLYALRRRMDSDAPFEIISGYRSPKTNAALAAKSRGVAKRSLHMQARAIDVRLQGRQLAGLHRAALAMKAGGVGLYSKSGFIHLDTGRVRRWGG